MEPTAFDWVTAVGSALAALAAIGAFIVSLRLEGKLVDIEKERREEEQSESASAQVVPRFEVVERHTTSGIAARTQTVTRDYRYIFLANHGEAPARDVTFELTGPEGEEVGGDPLQDVEDDEFPLPTLDPGTEYPLPFRLSPSETQMRLRAHVEWDDDEGHKSRTVWLRRT